MPSITFLFDKEKDIKQTWVTCNIKSELADFTKGISPNLIKICKNKPFDDCKEEINKFNEKIYSSLLIPITLDTVTKAWSKINDEYFKRLQKIMKHPIKFQEVKGYLITTRRCSYNSKEKWFMFSFFSPLQNMLLTAGHEIMHLHFHDTYFNKIEKQIGEQKTQDLKEALTVLLNLEFKDLWLVEDNGYEKHQELRKFIVKEWKSNLDFDVLLEKCVDYLRKN